MFHRAEFGIARKALERLAAPEFWEVGASGRRYSRQFVLDTLERRYAQPTLDEWALQDPYCLEIAPDSYLLTYTLVQGARVTRRMTLWRRSRGRWQALYHQGTEASNTSPPPPQGSA